MSPNLPGSLRISQPLSLPCHAELSRLARDDPQAFENLQRAMIDNLIEHAPERHRPRLRGLQFRIDGIRRLSRSAMGATVKIYQMMWDSFLQLNDRLQGVVNPAEAPDEARDTRRSAQVIAFQRLPYVDPADPAQQMLAQAAPVEPHQANK